jgi:hypothetical protein
MRAVVFSALLLFAHQALAQQTGLAKIEHFWTLDKKSQTGAKSRIPAAQQNPLPFCFSTAASQLYDQAICMQAGSNCQKQPLTSFLAITPAGQGFLEPTRLNTVRGGIPIKSLEYLLQQGRVSLTNCNYNHLKPTDTNLTTYLLTQELAQSQLNWLKYKDRAPYLASYFKFAFKDVLTKLSPAISAELVQELIEAPVDVEKIAAILLLPAACTTNLEKPKQFTVKFTKIDLANLRQATKTIDKLLSQQKPIIVNFCSSKLIEGSLCEPNNPNLHSLIIIGKATVVHQITGNHRYAYWLVNSWGEEWQEKNMDGWVFADKLLENITGELIWLDPKP